MAFTCPQCNKTSRHPQDEQYGYCGACHECTGELPLPLSHTDYLDFMAKHFTLRIGIRHST